MKGKIVLVTGASGGLGSHVVRAFLEAGASVVGTARKIEQSDFSSENFVAIPGDLSSRNDAEGLVNKALKRFGKLDVLAHTVGGFAGGQTIAETDEATFQQMFDMNVNSLFHVLQAALPSLRQTGDGRIIAIGSRAAVDPGPRVGAYSASKAAMVSLIKTVALENKDAGLRCNAILPGTIDTPANRKAMPNADVSKWVQPEALANLMVWLATDAGRDVNGAVLPVYGGDV
jgi:NAD(P)-dependent dehydrogenase (short-subunit alcohol dehydrogenase family)